MKITGYYGSTFDSFMITEGYVDKDGNYIPPSKAVPNFIDDYYDYKTGITYRWDGKQYVNKLFFTRVTYYKNNYSSSIVDRNVIYLAKPGQRIIGALNGVQEDSCELVQQLNNTDTLDFTVDRITDGFVSNFYDIIDEHYELYLPNYGWFKINEAPTLSGDGNTEQKNIHAESLEIELQQYDLVDFYINTADKFSKEYLAIDNTYEKDEYTLFHNQVLFYRDTRDLEALTAEFKELPDDQQTVSKLDELWTTKYPNAFYYEPHGTYMTFSAWRLSRDEDQNLQIDLAYHADGDDEDQLSYYTIAEFLDIEIQRMKELSFLDLVLCEHGWKIGFVDPYSNSKSDIEDDQIPLAYKVGFFEIQTQDIYSFLTQEAASYFRCMFLFDTENYTVNVYNINNIGYDTNIFLSFHNIQNSVERSSNKQLTTVFHVDGGEELDFIEVNFGEDWIEDISYFLTTEHFPQEFLDKYQAWQEYREQRRQDYIDNSLALRAKDQEIYELKYKVPIDGTDEQQWTTMTIEELEQEKANYLAMLQEYEEYIEQNGEEDFKTHFDYANYISIKNKILSTPLDALEHIKFVYNDDTNDGGYIFDVPYVDDQGQTITSCRLGNIDAAIFAKKQVNGDYIPDDETSEDDQGNPIIITPSYNERAAALSYANQKEFLDHFQYDFKTYGDSYGVEELQTQLEDLNNRCELLEKSGYNVAPENPIAYPHKMVMYELYLKYKQAADDCKDVLELRKSQLETAQGEYQDLLDQNLAIKDDVNIENDNFGFTDEELELLDKYRIHRDYTNTNLEYLTFDTPEMIIDKEKKLLADAKEQLYVESHPQWDWSTTQDNLYLIPEFKDWYSSLHVGNYIRISMRDDYQVKLRVIQVQFNPFMIDTTINLTFSSMTQYKSKRNDYLSLIEGGGGSQKNSISRITRNASAGDGQISLDSRLIMQLLGNGQFATGISNMVAGTAGNIINNQINTSSINVDQLIGTTAEFEELFTKYLEANVIATKLINADEGNFNTLTTKILRIGEDQITEIAGGAITTEKVIASLVEAQSGDFDELTADSAFIEYLNSGIIDAGTVTADNIIAGLASVTPEQMSKFNVLAGSAFIDYLETNMVVASEIKVDDLKAKLATIDVATIDQLYADNAFTRSLQTLSSTAATSVINDAYIYNAVADKISVGDLAAGDITLSNSMRILSENGQMVMNGTALQIMGEDSNGDPYVGIQLGYDTNQNPSLVLRNEDGATILTPEGITTDAIADGLIVNNMISDGTIQKGKLGFEIIEPNAQGGIDITQIYDGNGGLWGTQYTTFQQGTQQALESLRQDIEESANYDLFIETPNGTNIWGGNIQLNVKLLKNNVDVTDDFDASCFIWTRTSRDHDADLYWNNNHSDGAKVITITGNDVRMNADFQCKFEYENVTVVAG